MEIIIKNVIAIVLIISYCMLGQYLEKKKLIVKPAFWTFYGVALGFMLTMI